MTAGTDGRTPDTALPDVVPGTTRTRLLVGVVVVLTIALHAALWVLDAQPQAKGLWGDENLYRQCATRLLAGSPDWYPEALWPSLYPRLLAGVMGVLGPSLVWPRVLQTLLLLLAALVFADLVERLSGSRTAAAVGAMLMVGYPPLAAFAHYLWPEVLHLSLLLILLWILVARWDDWRWGVVGGLALGLALLSKNVLGPFVPVLIAGVAAGRPRRRWLGPCALLVATAALTVTPTVVGNARRIGVPMIADSSTFNLWVGLNDRGRRNFEHEYAPKAYVEYMASGTTVRERNTAMRARIGELLKRRPLGELLGGQLARQYFRLFDKDSYLTDQLPGGAARARNVGYRGEWPLLAPILRGASYSIYAAVLAAAPLGWLGWRFRDRRWLRVLLLFLAYNLAIFFWLHVKTRYRVQFLPVLFLGAGAHAAWWREKLAGGVAAMARWRWVTGAVLSVLLLVLAFAAPWL